MLKRRSSKFLGLLATLALAIVLSACGNSGSVVVHQTIVKHHLVIKKSKYLISRVIIQHHVH